VKRQILLFLLCSSLPLAAQAAQEDRDWGCAVGPSVLKDLNLPQRRQKFSPSTPALAVAQAQKQDLSKTAMVQKLYELSQDVVGDKIVPVRGGTKDKLLGIYINSNKVIFNSGYKDVDPKTQAEWAYDLHQFIEKNGGGWSSYQKSLSEKQPGSLLQDLNENARTSQGGKDPNDPMERAHVPYDKQAAFADKWWKENSQAYQSSVVPPKDWWTNDAVLDGNNLWTRWEQLGDKGSSEYASWRDAEMATLMQKK